MLARTLLVAAALLVVHPAVGADLNAGFQCVGLDAIATLLPSLGYRNVQPIRKSDGVSYFRGLKMGTGIISVSTAAPRKPSPTLSRNELATTIKRL
jgi:hypothetical protein